MVTGFSRSFSLPGSPRLKTRPASAKSHHVRSVSLPCRSHPLISRLEDEIRSVKTWQSSQPESASASTVWVCDGLALLEVLHTSLNEYLNLSQTRDSLHCGCGSEWTDRILDGSLRLADVHCCFRSEIMAMKEHQSEAQVALRRKDAVKLASSIKAMKKAENQITKLASSLLREVSKSPVAARSIGGVAAAEPANVTVEVINVTVSASASIFMGIAAVSSAKSAAMAPSRSSWVQLKKKKAEVFNKNGAMENLKELEGCVGAVERRSERLLRCFVNTRVSLLTYLTPSL